MRTLIACVMLSCTAFAGAPPSEPYTREVNVPEAGWYRVPVDGHLWRYARGRVLAFDETGKMLPCGILPVEFTSPGAEEAQPRLVKVEEEGDTLVLYLQMDKLAGKHDRLILDFTGTDALTQVALSGSADGKTWHEMARGTLFRLGPGERMQGTALDYPDSGFRHLKLALPGGDANLQRMAREFRVGNIRLHYAPTDMCGQWVEEAVGVQSAEPALSDALADPGEILMKLDLPQGTYPARAIELSLDGPEGPIPMSILTLAAGRVVGEYSCVLQGSSRRVPVQGGRLSAPSFLRINRAQILGSAAIFRRPVEDVYFHAARGGTITLAYGGLENWPGAPDEIRRPPECREAEPGPVEERPLRLSDELISVTRDPQFMQVKPAISWELIPPPGLAPGQWMQLPITEELATRSREAGGDGYWAIAVDGATAPTFHRVNPLPELIVAGTVPLSPDAKNPKQVVGEVSWREQDGSPIWLSASVQGAQELLHLIVEVPRAETEMDHSPGERPVDPWKMAGQGLLHCTPWKQEARIVVRTEKITTGRARLRVIAGDLTPPSSIRISMWRWSQHLVFPLLGGAQPRLAFGKFNRHNVAFDRYLGISRIPEVLPQGKLGRATPAAPAQRPWDRIFFLAGLVLAVAALLYLIVKLLPRRQEG